MNTVPFAYHLLTTAPRVLVQVGTIAALSGLFAGCVPAKQYEEAESAARAHAEARQRDNDKLREAEQRIAQLSAELERKGSALEEQQTTAASSKLDATVALKERDAAEQLVDQLRNDLARAGDHLASFSSEKRDLGKALLLAEQRMDAVERAYGKFSELVGVSRDLALLLGEGQSMGELVLTAEDGSVVLQVQSEKLFGAGGEALIVDAAPVLAGVARAAVAHEPLKVVLSAPNDSSLNKTRTERLSEALAERGVARTRLSTELPASAPAAVAPAAAAAPATPAQSAKPEPSKPEVYAFLFVP